MRLWKRKESEQGERERERERGGGGGGGRDEEAKHDIILLLLTLIGKMVHFNSVSRTFRIIPSHCHSLLRDHHQTRSRRQVK